MFQITRVLRFRETKVANYVKRVSDQELKRRQKKKDILIKTQKRSLNYGDELLMQVFAELKAEYKLPKDIFEMVRYLPKVPKPDPSFLENLERIQQSKKKNN
eukprot:TRINITY_DN169_c0_g2_i1.p1 TRINITY_DN169_c0_g2~~TRINITY_DN169_c0_g2_i1.p1  ORF type:complete len:102 (-),score=27.56 TRINITY_DN169_c0_g2_i1:55-360(-)